MKNLIAMFVVTGSLVCFSTNISSAQNPFGGFKKQITPASNIVGKFGETFSKAGKSLGRTFSPRPESQSHLSVYSESVDSHGYVWASSNTGNNRRTNKRARLLHYSNGMAYWSYAGKRWRANIQYNRQSNSGRLGTSAAGVPVQPRRPTIRYNSHTGRQPSAATKRQLQQIIDQAKRRQAAERRQKPIRRTLFNRGYRSSTRSRYSTNRP